MCTNTYKEYYVSLNRVPVYHHLFGYREQFISILVNLLIIMWSDPHSESSSDILKYPLVFCATNSAKPKFTITYQILTDEYLTNVIDKSINHLSCTWKIRHPDNLICTRVDKYWLYVHLVQEDELGVKQKSGRWIGGMSSALQPPGYWALTGEEVIKWPELVVCPECLQFHLVSALIASFPQQTYSHCNPHLSFWNCVVKDLPQLLHSSTYCRLSLPFHRVPVPHITEILQMTRDHSK